MSPKKNPKYALENRRGLFFQLGLVMALAATLTAFEWRTFTVTKHEVVSDWIYGEPEPVPPVIRLAPPERPVVKDEFNWDLAPEEREQEDEEVRKEQEMDEHIDLIGLQDSTETPPPCEYCPPPPKEPEVWVDEMPVLCDCESLETKAERSECTQRGIKSSLGSMNVPEFLLLSGKGKTVVYAQFVVDENGQISNLIFANETDVHTSLIREATKGIEALPCFYPAMKHDEKVATYYSLPITFEVR